MSWLTDLFGGGGGPELLGEAGGYGGGSGGGSFLSNLFGGGGSSGSSAISSLLGGGGRGSSGGYGSDILRLLGAAGGTAMNISGDRGTQERNQNFQREQLANQQLYGRPNTTGPMGSSNWAQDPTTHQWTQTNTLNEHDQARLDEYRRAMTDSQARQRDMNANPVDFSALAHRYIPQSLGGQYAGGNQWLEAGGYKPDEWGAVNRRLRGG